MRSGEAPDDESTGEYLERWLRAVKPTIDASTLTSYTDHVEHHIVPMLGSIRVRALTTRHVNDLIADRLAHVSPKTHRTLSPTTVRLIVTTLRTALATGVPHEIPDNVAIGAKMPRPVEHRVEPMTDEDADLLVDVLRATWLGPLARFLIGSGTRLGEALSLNQGDLMLDEGYIRLRTSKTTIRAVPLTDDAIEALRDALAAAPRRGKSEPVFFGPRGGDRLGGSSVSHALPRMLTDAGLVRLAPHGLRHGFATLMIGKGASLRLVGEQLGHRSASSTTRYAHVAPAVQRDAVKAAGRAVRSR
jgi:integrase